MELFYKGVKAEPQYSDVIQTPGTTSFDSRVRLLEKLECIFSNEIAFCERDEDERRIIAGLPIKRLPVQYVGWFGNMNASGRFHGAVKQCNENVSRALNCIPYRGDVDKSAYMDAWELFDSAFPSGGAGLGAFSRLIAMKRPDQFICINGGNRKLVSEYLDLQQSRLKRIDVYWNEVIGRIRESIWWQSDEPTTADKTELKVWKGRAAMLDAIVYREIV